MLIMLISEQFYINNAISITWPTPKVESKPWGWARRDYGFHAFFDGALGWQTYRGHCSGLDGDGAAALCGINDVGGYYHRPEAGYCRAAGHA
jgi:hypothetical protein